MEDQELLEYCKSNFIYLKNEGRLIRKFSRGGAKAGCEAGNINDQGYRLVYIKGRCYRTHRLIYLLEYGYLPEFIDHINQDRLDNRITNLRASTKSQNLYNRGATTKNTSGYKGVVYCKQTGKWRAVIYQNGKRHCLGRYNLKHDAASAYNEAALEYHGEFACLNEVRYA